MPRSHINTTTKGGIVERLCRDFLIAHGYEIELSRLSKGVFDRVAVRKTQVYPTPPPLLPSEKAMFPTQNTNVPDPPEELRYIQIKANSWRMDEASVQAMARTRLPEGSTREWWRHMDHKGRKCRIVPECWSARVVLPNATFHAIPLLPEWELAPGEDKTVHRPRPKRVKAEGPDPTP